MTLLMPREVIAENLQRMVRLAAVVKDAGTGGPAMLRGLASATERTLLGQPDPSPRSAERPPTTIRVEGRAGETVAGPFLVDNQSERDLDFHFEADPLIPPAGFPPPASPVGFDPAKLSLPCGGRAVVNAVIPVSEEFAPGQTYSTTLRVLGFQGEGVHLLITVPPTEAGT